MCSRWAPTGRPAAAAPTRTSVPGICNRRMRANGFTLIELLVTIAIIGLGTAAVALSLRGGESRQLQQEGARLGALFRIAQDEARISGRSLVWEADLEGYRFRLLARE